MCDYQSYLGCQPDCTENELKIQAAGQSCERFSWLDFFEDRKKINILSENDMKVGNFAFCLLAFTLAGKFIHPDDVALVHSYYTQILWDSHIDWQISSSTGVLKNPECKTGVTKTASLVDWATTQFSASLVEENHYWDTWTTSHKQV